jgi:hypothetical protein
MTHLRSEFPIQCRPPPVANSQLANRENISGENVEDIGFDQTVMQMDNVSNLPPMVFEFRSPSQNNIQPQVPSFQVVPMAVPEETMFVRPVTSQPLHSSHLSQHNTQLPPPRTTLSFGYNPATTESLIPLSALLSKKHKETVGISQF